MSKGQILDNKFFYIALRMVLYALLLTPLWVWSMFLFPFITTKILYFRLLVELAFLFYIVLAVKYPEIRPRWNFLTKAVWFYLGVVLLTSIFGVDFNFSFWGTIERGEGFLTLLHFAVYFTMLTAVLRTRKAWYKYLLAAVSVTVIVGLYGVAQLSNLSFVIDAGASRISGTIGNASFFAAVMLFGIFLSLYLLGEAPSIGHKIYLWSVFILELWLLYESQTRGAILAAVVAFLIYFLVKIFKAENKRIRFASLGLLFLLVLAVMIVYFNRSQTWVTSNYTLGRLASISLSDITTQSRFDTWQASWRGWKDRFVTGYGYENYHIAFNKYFPARIFKDQGSQIWFDRAHNIVLDIAVTSGILGLLAYLSILGTAGWTLIKLFRENLEDLDWQAPLILGVLLLAYFLQNMFVFDTQATYLMFFIFLAYVAFLKNSYLATETTTVSKGYPAGFVFPAIVTVLVLISAYFVNLKPALANYYATQGIKMAKAKLYHDVKPTFERALSYGTYMDQEIRQRLVDYSYEAINSGQLSQSEQEDLYRYVIDQMNKSLKESPLDVKNYLYLMNVLNRLSANSQVLDQVFVLGEKAVKLSPTRPQIYFELGQAYFSKKDFEQGLAQFKKAVDLNPEPKESHFNYLLAAIIAGRDDLVKSETKILTEKLGYKFSSQDYLSVARAYYQGGDKEKSLRAYRAALALDPKNPEIHGKLAAMYGEVCDLENTKLEVEETIKLESSFTLEGQEFLRRLETKCKK